MSSVVDCITFSKNRNNSNDNDNNNNNNIIKYLLNNRYFEPLLV